MFECLASIKVPSRFSSNIKGIINVLEKKFLNLKSHDYHVLMIQLLPIAFKRNSTSKCTSSHREAMCIPQCNFSEGIDSTDLAKLHNDVV